MAPASRAANYSRNNNNKNNINNSCWVDEDYYVDNPWYGQRKNKAVFSLGQPLPHKVRQRRKRPAAAAPAKSNKEDLAERGQAGSENIGGRQQSDQQQQSHQQQQQQHQQQQQQPATPKSRSRRTSAGVGHSEKVNDAGQPVFEYQPGRAATASSNNDNNNNDNNCCCHCNGNENDAADQQQQQQQPDYKIDSEPLGRREDKDVSEGGKDPDEVRNLWARLRARHPEPLAEFLATGVATFMGLAGALSVNLSASQPSPYGTYETACWSWGFAWMFGIYLGGGVSGAHMNPAISISLSIFRGFPWRSCAVYVAAQFAASLAAGALAWAMFADTIAHLDPGMGATAKTFFSTPQGWVSFGTAFLNQVVGGAIMTIAVFALGDDQNNPPGAGMHSLVLGLLVVMLKFSLGFNVGSALNPASDFGPRVVIYAAGYRGPEVFASGWWVYGPWLATLAGSVLGCCIYDGFVFVGSESPVNYRVPLWVPKLHRRLAGRKKTEGLPEVE